MAAMLHWAPPVDPAFAATPAPVMPSYSVSAKTETVKRRGTRLIVVRSVKVTGVGPSVRLAIRCSDCRRLRRVTIYRKKTAAWRQYTGVYWLLPRGRGISIEANDAGKLGRWTVLGPGRRDPNRLVFKASGCLRQLKANSRKRPRRIRCPAGTTVVPPDTPVPVASPRSPRPGRFGDQHAFTSAPGIDAGYGDRPRGFADVNGDGRADYCRFVGDPPGVFLSCMLALGTGGFGPQHAFVSARGVDAGYANQPSAFADVNGDRRADYCRFVGDPPGVFVSCMPALGG
jgi:hypothetical protein